MDALDWSGKGVEGPTAVPWAPPDSCEPLSRCRSKNSDNSDTKRLLDLTVAPLQAVSYHAQSVPYVY